jgi:hypothetical protein
MLGRNHDVKAMNLLKTIIRMGLLLAAAAGFLQQCGITAAVWAACAVFAGS